jgi:hypothetical protein
MKRLLIGCMLLFTACAPRVDVIDSGVSGTLTALAPTAILPADRATSTLVPTLAPPTAPITPTEPAAEEPSPTAPTDATVEPSATLEPTATATLAAVTVGDLIFLDTFDSPGPWSVGETDTSNVSVAGGVMTFTQKKTGSFSIRIVGKQGANFYAEVTAALADRCASGDRYGLIFRVQNPSNYYAFQVDCDGRYRLMRYVDDASTAIVDWTPSSAIQRGKQSVNTLAVTAQGDSFWLAINGTPLTTAADGTFAAGRFGLMVGANITQNFSVVFDNLQANQIP